MLKSKPLVDLLVPHLITDAPQILNHAGNTLKQKYPGLEEPIGDKRMQQRAWDNAVCKIEFENLLNSGNQVDSARLLAASAPHSGAWLNTLPLSTLGLHLDADTVRTSVSLRLGSKICEPHKCRS